MDNDPKHAIKQIKTFLNIMMKNNYGIQNSKICAITFQPLKMVCFFCIKMTLIPNQYMEFICVVNICQA